MKKFLPVLIVWGLLLGGCIHRPDIEQGNAIVTPQQTDQLRKGMTAVEVRDLLGTPLLDEPFNKNRLVYVYTFQPGKGTGKGRHMTLLFHDGHLAKILPETVFTLQN